MRRCFVVTVRASENELVPYVFRLREDEDLTTTAGLIASLVEGDLDSVQPIESWIDDDGLFRLVSA